MNRAQCEEKPGYQWVNRKYNFDNLGQALMALFVLSSKVRLLACFDIEEFQFVLQSVFFYRPVVSEICSDTFVYSLALI